MKLVLSLVTALVVLSGCAQLLLPEPAPPDQLLVLSPVGCEIAPERRCSGGELGLRVAARSPSFAGRRIVYSRQEGVRSAYQYSFWADPLPVMVERAVAEALNCSEVLGYVATGSSLARPRHILQVELIELTHYAQHSPGEVSLSLHVELFDQQRARLLAATTFTTRATPPRYDARGAAVAAEQALAEQLPRLRNWVEQQMVSQIRCGAQEREQRDGAGSEEEAPHSSLL